jgi:hypothetical protein
LCYEAAIASAGGDEATLAKSLIISLEDAAANWYSRLSPRCIYSWQQLKTRFFSTSKVSKRSSILKKIFCPALKERKKYCPNFTEGSSNSKPRHQRCQMSKSSCKLSKP